jgi:prepilin-type N-terminal cleavage/methylation domain-containing protein
MDKVLSIEERGGFTLIELLIVLGIIVMLMSLVTFSFTRTWASGSLEIATGDIVQAIHRAQVQAISGVTVDGSNPSEFGVYFEGSRVTVFAGSVYVASDVNNEVNDLPANMSIGIIGLPSQSIVFERVTGEVVGYSAGQDSWVVSNTDTGESVTMVVNREGTVTIN